ncbi:MAG: 5-(carboxyamino)imidazole ribonucleotide synthase [Saprospiraceae bacterium]|nr:5-(carboxyamino)imidazole ribonucleotide synthase [Saprospiraceae bacterium]
MKQYRPEELKIGVLGGGQLGKMLFEKALSLGLNLHFMDSSVDCSVGKISSHFIIGNLDSFENIIDFGKSNDIVTIEIEHVNLEALKRLELLGVSVYPQANVLEIIQDKGLQKQFLKENSFPTSPFRLFESTEKIYEALDRGEIQFPFVQKLRKGGYDGKGVEIIRNQNDLVKIMNGPSVVEEMADIEKELSVIVVRSVNGEINTYPSVSMEFHPTANLVEYLICPSGISDILETHITELSITICEKLNIVGLLAIEMFLNKDGSVWINEMAPRPHNSGHHTLNNGAVSQFENHLRAISGLPLGNTIGNLAAIMINLLGSENSNGPAVYEGFENLMQEQGVYPYLYGKSTTKPFRKMGHMTITSDTVESCIEKYKRVKDLVKIISITNG